jgi:antitoxin MazE
MQSNIAKWGNSLAVRLPAQWLRANGLHEGAVVNVSTTATGELRLTPARPFDKAAFLKRLDRLHKRMPLSAPVVEPLRREARY